MAQVATCSAPCKRVNATRSPRGDGAEGEGQISQGDFVASFPLPPFELKDPIVLGRS